MTVSTLAGLFLYPKLLTVKIVEIDDGRGVPNELRLITSGAQRFFVSTARNEVHTYHGAGWECV